MVSFLLHPHTLQNKLSFVFLILAILKGARQYLRVVLIYISLMSKDIELSFKCITAIEIVWLRILCLGQYLIFNLIIWFVEI